MKKLILTITMLLVLSVNVFAGDIPEGLIFELKSKHNRQQTPLCPYHKMKQTIKTIIYTVLSVLSFLGLWFACWYSKNGNRRFAESQIK